MSADDERPEFVGARVTESLKRRLSLTAYDLSEPNEDVPQTDLVRKALDEYLPEEDELEYLLSDDRPSNR